MPEEADGPGLAAFAAADEAETLGGRGLHADAVGAGAEQARERFPHRGDVAPDLGGLERYGDVYVTNGITLPAHHFHHARKEDLGVYAFEFVGSVGKMVSDVAQGERAEDGVAERVDGDIAVGVRHEARRAVDAHAAQPHREAFLQTVYVVSLTYPEAVHPTPTQSCLWASG